MPSRFHARVTSAWLECPACGTLIIIGHRDRQSKGVDRRTSTIECGGAGCGRKYVYGLILYSLKPGPGPRTLPRDQVPSTKRLAELRNRVGGEWADETRGSWRPDHTNKTDQKGDPNDGD